MGLLRRAPSFGRLLAAEVISPLGDAMGTVALILHVQRVEGTGTAVATVLVAESIPPLLSPYLGAIADRFAGRSLLVACAIAQAAVMATAAAVLPGVGCLFVLLLLRATFAAVAAPAVGAAVPALVDDADLPAANRLLGGGRELGTVFGPAMAGVLFAVVGARGVLAVDAATFLLTVPLLASVALPCRPAPTTDARTTVRADAVAGLRQLWSTPILRALAVGFWLVVLGSASDDLVLAFLATDDLEVGPAGTGVLLGAASVGLLIGLVALGRIRVLRQMPPFGAILLGFVVVSTGNLATAGAPTLAAAVSTQIVRGLGIASLEANVRTVVQRRVPRAMLGRVLANLYGGVSVAAALGYIVGGPLLDATSPRRMFVIIGLAGLGASGLAALLARRAGRDEGAPQGPLEAPPISD